jgi:hypothetical protein
MASHLLILQQLNVQIAFGRPVGASNVPQPGRYYQRVNVSVTDSRTPAIDLA